MSGSIALDVFIGLAFIYLLYSLFATILLELISTNFGIRAANLRKAIYRMLNDDKEDIGVSKNLWWALMGLFGKGFSQKSGGLARAVFNSPAIKYLGTKGFRRRGPSNISAQQFSKGLLSVLSNNPADRSQQALKIKSLMDKPMGFQIDETGEIKTTTQEVESIGFASASGISHLKYLFIESQGDLDKFKQKIEEWYEEMMLVATEWYKKRMQIWLLLIGFALAYSFNVNSLYIVKVLSVDKNAREQMVVLVSAHLSANDSLKSVDKLTEEELSAYRKEIRDQIDEAHNVIGLADRVPEKLRIKDATCAPEELEKALLTTNSYVKKPDGDYIIFEQPKGWKYLNFGEFINVENICTDQIDNREIVLGGAKLFWYSFLGYLVTALAISLGAPFWFDLLNKVMQLRGAASQKRSNGHVIATSSSTSDDTKG